jgi:histidyl-tRNA synthetase
MQQRGLTGDEKSLIVVLSMGDQARSFEIARELRENKFRVEAYVGTKKIPDQLKYADKRGAALVVMEGEDERAKGEVTIKDLKLGAEVSKSVESRAEWVGARAGQETVDRDKLVGRVREILSRKG